MTGQCVTTPFKAHLFTVSNLPTHAHNLYLFVPGCLNLLSESIQLPVGKKDGRSEGKGEGSLLGTSIGESDGGVVGISVGGFDGGSLGTSFGAMDGRPLGSVLGLKLGIRLGRLLGDLLGGALFVGLG